jgi:hypothetical protein
LKEGTESRKGEFKTPTLAKTSVHLCLFVIKPVWIALPLRGRASALLAMTTDSSGKYPNVKTPQKIRFRNLHKSCTSTHF